jgi:hypothetical protein
MVDAVGKKCRALYFDGFTLHGGDPLDGEPAGQVEGLAGGHSLDKLGSPPVGFTLRAEGAASL